MAFRDLRAALALGDGAVVSRRAGELDRLLRTVPAGRPAVPFGAAFIIYFREGIEAALLVGALLAGVRRLGSPEGVRYLHAGWLAAVPAGLLTWWLADRVVTGGADRQELMEALVALLAAAVLFSVSFWLISKAESRHWTAYLKRTLERGLGGRRLLVLSGLAFLAVYREAAETVLFTQALLFESPSQRGQVLAGAAAGLLSVCVAAYLMSRTARRLPLGPFFAVSGALMCVLSISFAGSGLYALVAAGYLTPRPVPFPEIPWLGIHPDLTSLLIQLAIAGLVGGAALTSLRRRPGAVLAPGKAVPATPPGGAVPGRP
jgi:high-affinity iron transporter